MVREGHVVGEEAAQLLRKTLELKRTKLLVWVTIAMLTLLCCGQLTSKLDDVAAILRTINEDTVHEGAEFEYIVVGAGAAGGAAAARLALGGAAVLLVEAGGDPGLLTRMPGSGGALQGGAYDYAYATQPNNASCLSSRGAACRFSRGRAVGGSTAINLMMYTRGGPQDYDYNLPGWTWKDIEPYFLRSEGLRDLHRLPPSSAAYHNTSGVVPIGFFPDTGNPWQDKIIKGFNALGVPFNADINAESQIGVSRVLAYTSKGERVNTAETYLNIPGVKKNLRLLKNTKCLKVIIDENNTARGVIVVRDNKMYRLYAKKEVILSAGTIGSTHLLLLSGVGPAEHLIKHNISVKADLPVGKQMSDHFAPLVYMKIDDQPIKSDLLAVGSKVLDGLQWLVSRRGPLATPGLTDISTFLNTKCYDFKLKRLLHDRPECEVPTSQFIHAYLDRGFARLAKPIYDRVIRHVPEVANQMVIENDRSAFIVVTLPVLQPYSRGWIELASADVFDVPLITPNYLQDERDVEEIVRAIKILEDLTQTAEYRRHNASLFKYRLAGCPGGDQDGYWACYARHMTYSVQHAAGTAALGVVVDGRLRVGGVRGLRVADASVVPRPPGASTAAVALAIGERVADFVLEDNAV